MKFDAAVLIEQGKDLEIVQLEVPKLEVGQVLVDVRASGVCGKQLAEINGEVGADSYLPHCLGHEGAGIVADVGPGVSQVKAQDPVVLHWRPGRGIQALPAKYKNGTKKVGGGPVHTFQQFAIVSENRVTRHATDLSPERAALFGCAVTTGLGAAINEACVRPGRSVCIVGCGAVGIFAVQGARLVSATPITVVDTNKARMDVATSCGASQALGPEAFQRMKGEYDVVIDTTGNAQAIEAAYDHVGPGGLLLLVGQPPAGTDVTFKNMRSHYCGKAMTDSQGGRTDPTVDIPAYERLWRIGLLNLDLPLGKFSLARVNDAIRSARNGDTARSMLMMGENNGE